MANAIDVLQRELDALLVGDVHSCNTSCLHAQRRPAAHALREMMHMISLQHLVQSGAARYADDRLMATDVAVTRSSIVMCLRLVKRLA